MKRRKIETITIKEFNQRISELKKDGFTIILNKNPELPLGFKAYIVDKIVNVELTYKDPNTEKACTYVCNKACDNQLIHEITGMNAFNTLQHYFKVPHISSKEEAMFSASPLLYYNEKYNETRTDNCIGYDVNSSYSWGMLQLMPKDTEKGPINKHEIYVKEGEIGFSPCGELCLPGEFAEYIFNSEESPFKRFVSVWYNKKKATTGQNKQNAKDMLNMCIGYLQRINFWYRSAILGYCNRRIEDIMKKYKDNILLCNTDSVISTVRIPEIEENIGDEVGQWKIEHTGSFAYSKMNYQWDNEIPTYRGVSKKWFSEGYDILKDPLPYGNNVYALCSDYKLRRVTNE